MLYHYCKKCGKKGLYYSPWPGKKKRGSNLRGNYLCKYCGKRSI